MINYVRSFLNDNFTFAIVYWRRHIITKTILLIKFWLSTCNKFFIYIFYSVRRSFRKSDKFISYDIPRLMAPNHFFSYSFFTDFSFERENLVEI